MSDIFLKKDVAKLLRGKYLLLLGCSNMRALYRDILWLLKNDKFVPTNDLRLKLDFSYLGDRLLKQGQLNRGRDYIEMREYKDEDYHIKFNFLTKLFTEEVEEIMNDIKRDKCQAPDIVLINSCIWDITRWGPDGVNLYKKNMHRVMTIFKESLPAGCLVIYSTSLPVSPSCYGSFLIKQVEFMKNNLRFEIMEANLFAKQVVPTYGYNILDFHYHFRMQIHWRTPDGVHWHPIAVRHMSNILLTHIALCYGTALPGNFKGAMLERYQRTIIDMKHENLSAKLSKLAKFYKDPHTIKQYLKKIPVHLIDDVNNLLKMLLHQNSSYSNSVGNTLRQSQNIKKMYHRNMNDCRGNLSYHMDKENQGYRYNHNMNIQHSPSNNTFPMPNQSRFFNSLPYRKRFEPTQYNINSDNNGPDSFDERFYEGKYQYDKENVPPVNEFRASCIHRSDEWYDSNYPEHKEQSFILDRYNNGSHRNYDDEYRRDNSPNMRSDIDSFNDLRRNYEDRQRYNNPNVGSGENSFNDLRRNYEDRQRYNNPNVGLDGNSFHDHRGDYEDRQRYNYSNNHSGGNLFCDDFRESINSGNEGSYNNTPDCHNIRFRNDSYDHNITGYSCDNKSSSDYFRCDRNNIDEGRRIEYCDNNPRSWERERIDFNRFEANDLYFTNLEQLSYSNNNSCISGPYEQRRIFNPLKDNSNILHRQRWLPYR